MHLAGTVLSMLVVLAAVPVPVPDKPWSKVDGDFAATLEFSRQEEVAAIRQGLAPDESPRGMSLFAGVTFSGCAKNEAGKCDVVARFTTKAPEGKPLGEPIELDLARMQMPGQDHIQMLTGKLGVTLEPLEVLGVYRVKVEVVDRVAQKHLVLERDFTVVDAPRS